MTEPETPTCCGRLSGEWVPKPGQPQVHACQLCPWSGRYWSPERREQRAAELEAVNPKS